jgi:hypothetical protein
MKPCIAPARFLALLHAFETAHGRRFLCVRANHKAPDAWISNERPTEGFVQAVEFAPGETMTVEQMDGTIRGLWNASRRERENAAKLARYYRAKKEKPDA